MFQTLTNKDAYLHRLGENAIKSTLGFDPNSTVAGLISQFSEPPKRNLHFSNRENGHGHSFGTQVESNDSRTFI